MEEIVYDEKDAHEIFDYSPSIYPDIDPKTTLLLNELWMPVLSTAWLISRNPQLAQHMVVKSHELQDGYANKAEMPVYGTVWANQNIYGPEEDQTISPSPSLEDE